jgi:hypothetical protein
MNTSETTKEGEETRPSRVLVCPSGFQPGSGGFDSPLGYQLRVASSSRRLGYRTLNPETLGSIPAEATIRKKGDVNAKAESPVRF